jgi:hypothetical protein
VPCTLVFCRVNNQVINLLEDEDDSLCRVTQGPVCFLDLQHGMCDHRIRHQVACWCRPGLFMAHSRARSCDPAAAVCCLRCTALVLPTQTFSPAHC